MSASNSLLHRRLAAAVLAMICVWSWPTASQAQVGLVNQQQTVGGVMIDANNVIQDIRLDEKAELLKLRRQALQDVPRDLKRASKLRMVSLARLQAAIATHVKDKKSLPDDMVYLAGLQRIQYIFVFPEQKDIVLAGPAEGWKLNDEGNVVGVNTGRPVVRLDDLLVALRTVETAARQSISCSIDPTPEGMARLQSFLKKQTTIGPDPEATFAEMERELGLQRITITGVPDNSRFANVLVAADYRMKRLGMNFDPSPVHGMPSYLEMLGKASTNPTHLQPRWWMAAKYEPLLTDADGLSWQIRGQGVKTVAEEDLFGSHGQREKTVKANPLAQKWADTMTEKFEELAARDTIFGDLRNCMDVAVVAALLSKHHLIDKAGLDMHLLLDGKQLITAEMNAPKSVASRVSPLKKGKNWITSVSGGVQFQPMEIAGHVTQSPEVAAARGKVAADKATHWWWD